MSAGKGDTYRKVDSGKYRDNWDKVFGGKAKLVINGVEITGFESANEPLHFEPDENFMVDAKRINDDVDKELSARPQNVKE